MTIKTVRISFVFTETILDLQQDAAAGAPLAHFVTEPGYRNIVEALQRQEEAPLGLTLPWPQPVGHHFWDYYVADKNPGDADGKLCFEKLVPLRLPKLADTIDADLACEHRETIEGFYFTFGVGLLISVDLLGEFDIDKAGSLALNIRYDNVFKPAFDGAAAATPLNLQQTATEALNRLRALGFGKVAGTRSAPFSVATVLSGADIDPNQPLTPDSETHRLLSGLSGWAKAYRHLPLPPPLAGQTQLKTRAATALPGDVLYAAKRGRAVWFPSLFGPESASAHSLGCYHRNLIFGSLQTESLLGLASAVEGKFAQGAIPPNSIQQLGRLAAGLLGRLHGGAKTYSSDSLRAQVAQSGNLPDVESLRHRLGMSPIVPPIVPPAVPPVVPAQTGGAKPA